MKDISLMIAMPHARDVKPYSCASLAGLSYRLGKIGLGEKYNLEKLELAAMANVSLLPRGRQAALDKARAGGFSHLLMIDDDMTFPPDVAEVLISREKPIVAVNYIKKKQGAVEYTALDLNGKEVSSKGAKGIQRVGYVGLGMVLVDIEAIKDVPRPHFEIRLNSITGEYMGEDFYFCAKLREADVHLWLDHDVSNYVGHVGDFIYRDHDFSAVEYEKTRKELQNAIP